MVVLSGKTLPDTPSHDVVETRWRSQFSLWSRRADV